MKIITENFGNHEFPLHLSWRERERERERDFLPITQKSLQVDYHLLLMISEVTTLNTRPEVISPSKSAALTASEQT